jgi:hypothetical protein
VDPAMLEQLRSIGSAGLESLEARESRSSLAGVLAATAVEGVSLHGLGEHVAARLDGPAPASAPPSVPAGAPPVQAHLAAYRVAERPTGGGSEPPENSGSEPPDTGGSHASGSEAPEAPDANDLLHNHNIAFDADGIRDIRSGRVDPRLVSVLDRIAGDHKITVSAIKSDHGRLTAGGSVSNHYYGRALDISVVDGRPVGPGNEAAKRVAAGLIRLPGSIRPTEIGSPWKFSNPAYFSDAAHQNHLHIGYDDPAPDGWKPPPGSDGPSAQEEPSFVEPDSEDDVASDDSEGDDGSEAEDGGSGDTEAEADEESDGSAGGGDDEDDEDEDDDSDSGDGDHDDDSGDSDDGDDGASGGESGDSGDSGDSSDGGDSDSGGSDSFQDPGIEVDGYPGDDAPKPQIAAWMASEARKRGIPGELPIMASLVESGLHNVQGGDADSVGYFQMRVGIWNRGAYAGYPGHPEKQLDWFLDQAEAVKKQRAGAGRPLDSGHYGDWIADVERPAAQYRGRYQPMLAQARDLLEHAGHNRGGSGSNGGGSNGAGSRQELTAIDPGAAGGAGGVRSPRAMLSVASRIDRMHLPYKWGGGHGAEPAPIGTPVDCSGYVAQILGVKPRTSGGFMSYGRPGPGREVTIYANSEHVLIQIGNRFFGTSGSNPGGGAGEIPRPSPSYLSNFTRRHPPGM